MVETVGTRFARRGCFSHPQRLGTHAIDHAPGGIRHCGLGRVVSRTLLAALPDVLGGALGLFAFPVHCTARTGGQSHYLEPARPAVHRYSDESHVPQCSVVVLRHADSIRLYFSSPFLDGSPAGTGTFFVTRVRCRILYSVHIPRRLATKWFVDAGWVRNLSSPRVRAGDGTGNVAQPIECTRGMARSSRGRIRHRP